MMRLPTDALERPPLAHTRPERSQRSRRTVALWLGAGAVAVPLVGSAVTLLLLPLGGVQLLRRLRRRAAPRHRLDAVHSQLPEIAMLVAVGLGGGLPLGKVCATLAATAPEPFRSALQQVVRRQAHGHGLIDALELELDHLGGGAELLVPLLRSHVDDGAAVSQALFDVAESARQSRRRSSEAQARRLPVRMLVPLIVCVLPAFMALTIVPVVVESLRSFDL